MTSAYRRELAAIPNASHPIEGKDAIQQASTLVAQWFMRYLGAATVKRGSVTTRNCGTTNVHRVR
jgi:hypothetical protein